MRYTKLGQDDAPTDIDVIDAVHRVSARRGVSLAEVALAWLLSRPIVTAPIIGATKLPHLQTALGALELTLNPAEMAELDAPYRPHDERGFR